MRKKLIFALVLLVALSGLAYTGYILNKNQKAETIPVINIVEERRTPLFIPHYLAMQLGFFADQNIEVRLSAVQPGKEAHRLLEEKKADVVICSPGQAILTGPPKKGPIPTIIAEITKRDGAFLFARQKLADNFQWEEVKGRTIISGFPTEDTSLILEHLLRANEISPNWNVNVIENLPFNLRPGTFKSGTGSFIVVEEPEVSKLEREGLGKAVVALGKAAGEMPGAVYLTDRSYLDSHHDEVQKLVNGLYYAQQWMNDHSAEEIAAAVKNFFPDYDHRLLVSIIERYQKTDLWSKKPLVNKASYDNLYRAVDNAGELVNKVSYSKAVTDRFARKAIQQVHYVPEDQQKPKPGLNRQYIKYLFAH